MRVAHRIEHLQEQHHALAQAQVRASHQRSMGSPSTRSITKYGSPSLLMPPSSRTAMFGCCRPARICRSRRKRSRAAGESALARISLSAARCVYAPSLRSTACTAPMPPWPMVPTILHAPIARPMAWSPSSCAAASALPQAAASPANGSLACAHRHRQQCMHLRAQRVVSCAHRVERAQAVLALEVGDRIEDRQRAAFAVELAHADISASRKARALRQSRRRVRSLMPSIPAISTSE
jgi:hypothetical protein